MSHSIEHAEGIGVSGSAATTSPMAGPETPAGRGGFAAARDTAGAVVGAVLGLVPHVMHHIGLLAGAALVTGVGGNLLFFAVGLVLSIPLLRRLYRRFQTWLAPTVAVGVFAALFSISAFVIGPAISGGAGAGDQPPSQAPSQSHDAHHGK